MKKAILCLILTITPLTLAGCCPGYVLTAAFKQSSILLSRESISSVIDEPGTDPEIRSKLVFVEKARRFASSIGLDPGDSFTFYAPVEGDVVSWVVMAAPPDELVPVTWWFPIVGRVPYLGFFDKASAIREATKLEREGHETIVRGADAFSTLGWFNDPILSTTLRRPTHEIVETVLHESVHSTVWIPGNVEFNESLANFIGMAAAVQFFFKFDEQDANAVRGHLDASLHDLRIAMERGRVIQKLGEELRSLYSSPLTREEKLRQRDEIFAAIVSPSDIDRGVWPASVRKINNVLVLHYLLYHRDLDKFCALASSISYDWNQFMDEVRQIAAAARESNRSPFELLREHVDGKFCRLPY